MNLQFSFASLDALVWMTIAVASFWVMPRFKIQVLTLVGFTFLLSADPISALILAILTILTFGFTHRPLQTGTQTSVAILLIFSVLAYYKISFINSDPALFNFVPMGISYYTLRCIHFIMERYKNRIEPQTIGNLAAYLFFLPTLWIGPIHRYEDFDKDRRRMRWNGELFSQGLERLLIGYFKVIVIANMLLNQTFAGWVDSLPASGLWLTTYLEMVGIGLTLYMLFSGYSDIAIGFGYLLGFKVMENFRFPFLQKNISDFWRNWHISLTNWCREYIYNTVVAQTRRPELGVIATLLVIAMWHEVSWRYFLWGLYHGLGILIWQKRAIFSALLPKFESNWYHRLMLIFSILLTVHFVWLGFILVRQDDINSMVSILRILFFFH